MTFQLSILLRGCVAVSLFVAASLCSASASLIHANRLVFERVGTEGWWRTRVELSATGSASNDNANLRADPRFLDNVRCTLFLSFQGSRDSFVFFQSTVEIITLEQGKLYVLDFFLPREVVVRDRLSSQPFAYLLRFEEGGREIPFESSWASGNLQSASARQALVRHCGHAVAQQGGILMPSYHVPVELTLRDRASYPPFRRRDPAAF